jgi:glycosyltransferase involved in cell wall biosynthesis
LNQEYPFLSLVVPCYNEEEVLEYFLQTLTQLLQKLSITYEIIFINDGSKDNTLTQMVLLKSQYPCVRILNLSRNFGKEAALTAGIDYALGEVVVPMDVDLQDPPQLLEQFIEKYREGYDVVLAKRADRSSDSFLKKISAEYFYKLHGKISDIDMPQNVGDYRLMSRKVVDELKKLPENQRFMKGLFAWVGFKTTTIEYKREPRFAGKTSFNGWKLWNFAIEGITSFSTAPLKIWFYIGFITAFVAFIFGTWILIKTLLFGVDSPGYASLITVVLFLGGIQLMGIGILGEYIGRIYLESKKRPVYIIEAEL